MIHVWLYLEMPVFRLFTYISWKTDLFIEDWPRGFRIPVVLIPQVKWFKGMDITFFFFNHKGVGCSIHLHTCQSIWGNNGCFLISNGESWGIKLEVLLICRSDWQESHSAQVLWGRYLQACGESHCKEEGSFLFQLLMWSRWQPWEEWSGMMFLTGHFAFKLFLSLRSWWKTKKSILPTQNDVPLGEELFFKKNILKIIVDSQWITNFCWTAKWLGHTQYMHSSLSSLSKKVRVPGGPEKHLFKYVGLEFHQLDSLVVVLSWEGDASRGRMTGP